MAKEFVTVGGYSTWEDVTVEAGAAHACRSCTITAAEPQTAMSAGFTFTPGAEVSVEANGDPLMKGYVDTYAPAFGRDFHTATITARSKSKDLVDCSAVHDSGEWKDKTLIDIAQDLLKPFGLQIQSDIQNLPKIPIWRLAPGATVFNELEVLARQHGALLIGTPDGNLKLTKADNFQLHSGSLQEGVNILCAQAALSEKGKHDKTHARGQKSKGSGAQSLRLELIAQDQTVRRYRPKIVIVEGDTDDKRVKQRAQWEMLRAAGWSTTASITVASWRDFGGSLWDPEKLVFVESQKLKISQPMAISACDLPPGQAGRHDGGPLARRSQGARRPGRRRRQQFGLEHGLKKPS